MKTLKINGGHLSELSEELSIIRQKLDKEEKEKLNHQNRFKVKTSKTNKKRITHKEEIKIAKASHKKIKTK